MPLNLSTDVSIFEERLSIYTFAAIVLGFIGFFSFVLNLLVIVTIVKNANVLWTPNTVVLVNMVVGDFLVAALGNPFSLTSAIASEWFWSHEVCLRYAWFMTTMGFASIGNLTVMAIERFLLIAYPMKTLSIRHAYILAFLVWIYALSLSLPPFFNWGIYGPEAGNISCSVSWEVYDPMTNNDTYIGFLFIFGFLVPIIIITSSYCSIIKTLKKIGKKIGAKNKREKKITKMVYLMILTFLIAWMPYAILALATQYLNIQPSHIIAVLPTLLAKSSICYNPIIYATMTVQFSDAWKRMFSINRSNVNNKQPMRTSSEIERGLSAF